MPAGHLHEQLTKYLADAHSIEQQALVQMRLAPRIAGDPQLEAAFSAHLRETDHHERLIRERLEARGASPSPIKDIAGTVTGVGFALFARFQPDTPGKLVTHAFSYEHMELAAYDLLIGVAERAGDSETVRAGQEIRPQELAMSERLEALFDTAVEASLRDKGADDVREELVGYLTDAHALEKQAEQLLDKGADIAGADELKAAYQEHLGETLEHQRLLEQCLETLDAGPNRLKDAGLALGALNWGGFFGAQPDTPAKLAGFSYAFEHLEIGAYELLRRVARRAGDADTESVAERVLAQERAAAARIHELFAVALDITLTEHTTGGRS